METKNRWTWEAVSSSYTLSDIVSTPDPPGETDIVSHFIVDGDVDRAIGEFVREMLNQGYTVTILGYEVRARVETVRTWSTIGKEITHYYRECKTHTRLWVDFRSDPECFLSGSPLVITAGAIVAIGKAIAIIIVAAAIFYALQNLTTTKKTHEKYGWVQNPETGEWEWQLIEREIEEKPPTEAWIGIVIIAIFLLIAIFGIGQFTGRK